MTTPDDILTQTYQGPPRIFSAGEFATRQMKPRPWLVPDWLPGNQVSSIGGEGGGGKSTIGLQLCVCVVSGRSWLEQHTARGPAIYLASEDDEDEVHRRLDSICVHYGLGYEDLSNLHIWSLATDDPALVIAGKDDTVEPTARWSQLTDVVERIKPAVLVLDSRADVFAGSEISRAQARGFIALLRKLAIRNGCGVVLLSHPSLSGISSGSGGSGSTHWRNAVRADLYLKRDEEDAPDVSVLESVKANYGPCGRQLRLRWSAGAFEVLEGVIPINRQEAADNVDRTFLKLLETYTAQGRSVSDRPGPTYAPAIFGKDPEREGATKFGFSAAMLRLFSAGKIRVEEVGPASRRKRQIVVVG